MLAFANMDVHICLCLRLRSACDVRMNKTGEATRRTRRYVFIVATLACIVIQGIFIYNMYLSQREEHPPSIVSSKQMSFDRKRKHAVSTTNSLVSTTASSKIRYRVAKISASPPNTHKGTADLILPKQQIEVFGQINCTCMHTLFTRQFVREHCWT